MARKLEKKASVKHFSLGNLSTMKCYEAVIAYICSVKIVLRPVQAISAGLRKGLGQQCSPLWR